MYIHIRVAFSETVGASLKVVRNTKALPDCEVLFMPTAIVGVVETTQPPTRAVPLGRHRRR